MKPKFLAIPNLDGTYNLQLRAANGEIIFNDRQGRPFDNLKRDLRRIKAATAVAKLEYFNASDE